MSIRFLLPPLPATPWPSLALRLPPRTGGGDASGLPRFLWCPSGRQARRWGQGRSIRRAFIGNKQWCMTHCFRRDAFWPQLPRLLWETRVSCFMVTAVLSNVHMCFPFPIPRPPSRVLLAGFIQLTSDLCARARVVYPWLRTTQLLGMHAQTRSRRSRRGFGERNKAPKAVPLCWPPGEAAAAVLLFCNCSVQATEIPAVRPNFVARRPKAGPSGRKMRGIYSTISG